RNEEMEHYSGMYSEIEFIKTGSSVAADNRSAGHAVKLNSPEWEQTVQKLAAMFNADSVAAGVSPAKGARITQIKTGVVSALQEDDARYYAAAVISKSNDRLKFATVAWPKETLDSWLTSAESQVPTTMAAAS